MSCEQIQPLRPAVCCVRAKPSLLSLWRHTGVRLCAPGHLPRCRRTPARPAAHGSCRTPSASCTGGAFPGVLCSHEKSKSHASPQGSSGEGFQRPHADPLGWLGQRTRPLEERLTRGNTSHNETLNVSGCVAASKGRDTGHNHPSCHLAHTCGDSSGLACPPRASQAQAPPLVPPTPMPSTHRCPREVDTSLHCCPHSGGD